MPHRLPPPPPPPPAGPPRPLRTEIERSFGSVEDFLRALREMTRDPRRGGWVYLVCTPQGRLRLVRTPQGAPPPRGEILFRVPAGGSAPPNPDWPKLSERYDRHMRNRPPFPAP